MSGKATLTLDTGTQIELNVIEGTEGEKAIDLKPLRKQTGYITLDPGFLNTGSCTSAITFIDGEKGILHYRGYPIEQLAEQSSFLEVAYLLVNGALPSADEYSAFVERITNHTLLNERLKNMFNGFPQDAHPMAILSSMTCALSTYYPDALDPLNPDHVELSAIRLLAKMPTIAAYSYKASRGEPFIYPDNSKTYTGNFLKMMFGYPTTGYEVDEEVAKILDVLLILHADHEQNCSTTTTRVVGSSRANLFASISSGINALWGPLHGGANQKVLEMLDVIVKDNNDVDKYVALAQDKDSDFRLMGFGHRVYKNYDPRARILGGMAETVLGKLKKKDPLLDVARRLEEHALNDSYFKDRKLYPNVDFYSGIIYRALGIPVNMFTVMFALGRLPGWIAQWKENHSSGIPIGRPRQIYVGDTDKTYVPMSER